MARRKKAATSGRKDGVNRSQMVRDYLAAHPEAMPKEVATALTEQGVPVTAQLVSTIKFNLAHKGEPKRGAAKVARGKGRRVTGSVSIESLRAAKNFVEFAGGISNAHAVLDALESLR